MATWGNLANRMLSFAYKRFDGVVPEPGDLDDEDRALLEKVLAYSQADEAFATLSGSMESWASSPDPLRKSDWASLQMRAAVS